MPELERVPISEKGYDRLNQAVRDWIEQDLKWRREDIFSIDIKSDTVENPDSTDWKTRWKHGRNVDVTVEGIAQEKHRQRFVRLDNGQWQKG